MTNAIIIALAMTAVFSLLVVAEALPLPRWMERLADGLLGGGE